MHPLFKVQNFEGSLTENSSFLSLRASVLKKVSQKGFVFELQRVISERSLIHKVIFAGSLADKLRLQLNHTSVDNQIT